MNNLFEGLTKALRTPNDVKLARDRIRAATQFFLAHFDMDGNPINEDGEKLFKKYENVEHYNVDKLRAEAKWHTIPVLILKDGKIIFDDAEIREILNNVLSKGNR